jgi:hypothetical protein
MDLEGPADGTSRDVREDEVPEYVWEFGEWLRRHCTRHRVSDRPTLHQWLELSAEARRRGITFHEDSEIEYRKH